MHPKTILDTCNDNIKKASVSLIFEGRKNSGLFSTIIGLLSNETLYCKYCEEIYNKIKDEETYLPNEQCLINRIYSHNSNACRFIKCNKCYEKHSVESCPYNIINCYNCHKNHIELTCPYSIIDCPYCSNIYNKINHVESVCPNENYCLKCLQKSKLSKSPNKYEIYMKTHSTARCVIGSMYITCDNCGLTNHDTSMCDRSRCCQKIAPTLTQFYKKYNICKLCYNKRQKK